MVCREESVEADGGRRDDDDNETWTPPAWAANIAPTLTGPGPEPFTFFFDEDDLDCHVLASLKVYFANQSDYPEPMPDKRPFIVRYSIYTHRMFTRLPHDCIQHHVELMIWMSTTIHGIWRTRHPIVRGKYHLWLLYDNGTWHGHLARVDDVTAATAFSSVMNLWDLHQVVRQHSQVQWLRGLESLESFLTAPMPLALQLQGRISTVFHQGGPLPRHLMLDLGLATPRSSDHRTDTAVWEAQEQ